MLLQAYPWNLEAVARCWERVVQHGEWPEERVMDPMVLRSWRRCLVRGLSSDGEGLLDAGRTLGPRWVEPLLATAARPLLEDLFQFGELPGSLFLLLDREGTILDVTGRPQEQARWAELGVWPGSVWAEGVRGTNGFSLALSEAFPALVVGPEHYQRALHGLWTAGAPVFGLGGEVVGVIGALGAVDTAHPHSLALVMSAARSLEYFFQAEHFVSLANQRYTELEGVFQAIGDGVLIWNPNGVILHANEAVQRALHVPVRQLLGRKVEEVFHFPEPIHQAMATGRDVEGGEVHLGVFGRSIRCWLELRVLREGERVVGYAALLRPADRLQRWIQRVAGSEVYYSLERLTGRSVAMRRLRHQARRAAQGRAPILLVGESGVGKNPLARAIHQGGPQAAGPFVPVNCRAIPKELMLVEFFGYEAGAFRGALAEGRPSKFELAQGGTLFLEGIESLTLELQNALVQVVDTGMVMRVGGTRAIPVSFRLIASTTEDLRAWAAEGRFSPDLLYRFSAFTLRVPSLRERKEDIPLLVEEILRDYAAEEDIRVTPEAMAILQRYPWPGNVRELEHVLERVVYEMRGREIRPEHLPAILREREWVVTEGRLAPVMTMAEMEREAIIRAARAAQGKVGEMAAMLGISRTTLWRRLKAYGIDPKTFRPSR